MGNLASGERFVYMRERMPTPRKPKVPKPPILEFNLVTRVDRDLLRRFQGEQRRRGVTESVLLRQLLDEVLPKAARAA